MNKILVTTLSSMLLGSAVYAGSTYMAPASKEVVATTHSEVDLYRANEWSIGVFGTYAFTESTNERVLGDHAFGGGLAVNYFITKNIGIGLEAQALRITDDNVLGSGALNVFYRMPIGNTGFAPYVYGGGGLIINTDNISVDEISNAIDDNNKKETSDDTLFEGHVGAGVEYRFSPHVGVFTDGRWTMPENGKNNFPSVRAGVTFAF